MVVAKEEMIGAEKEVIEMVVAKEVVIDLKIEVRLVQTAKPVSSSISEKWIESTTES